MAVKNYPIMTLSDMIDEFDEKEPCQGRETTAFIKRWKLKELDAHHRSPAHLTHALACINGAEIQNIRETKKFRDEQKAMVSDGRKTGHLGGRTTARRRMVRDGTFAVESE